MVEAPDEVNVVVEKEVEVDDSVTLAVNVVEFDPESIVLVKFRVTVGRVDFVVVADCCVETVLVEP